jgi:hypothetical protein
MISALRALRTTLPNPPSQYMNSANEPERALNPWQPCEIIACHAPRNPRPCGAGIGHAWWLVRGVLLAGFDRAAVSMHSWGILR